MGTVNEMSVTLASETFWTIMSTFTCSSASERNRRAAIPGRSATWVTVTLASAVSCTTAEMIACSIEASSCWIHVPGSHVKLERTCSGTPWLRANSTDRMSGFGHPLAHISSISSNDTFVSRRAVGTTRGSAVNTPDTSV